MKIKLIILTTIAAFVFTWLYLMSDDKKPKMVSSTVKQTKPVALDVNQESYEPTELIAPSVDESNAYILDQIARLDLESLESDSDLATVRAALAEMNANQATVTQNTSTITEATTDVGASPLEAREFDENESEEDLIKRLSKQTGMSEADIREAFKGQ